VNLAFSLAARHRARVGVLDLDIFGPSIPKLLGLETAGEPHLTSSSSSHSHILVLCDFLPTTSGGALIPLTNHGLPAMSIGFLLPGADAPLTWRGLMVQKAVQQLLFDVDWRGADPNGPGLDILVIDMPPGTGDVPLSLGQLVNVDGMCVPLHTCIYHIRGPHRYGDCFNSTGCRPRGRPQGHSRLSKAFYPSIFSTLLYFLCQN
jgi:ATP-binding protein involved in chromosome partitioning